MSILLSSDTPKSGWSSLDWMAFLLLLPKSWEISAQYWTPSRKATTIRAEIPELSPVNWTSFFTGSGPEKHGTFGFSRMNPNSYELSITNSEHIQCPTVFDWLDQSQLVSRVINLLIRTRPNHYVACSFPVLFLMNYPRPLTHLFLVASWPKLNINWKPIPTGSRRPRLPVGRTTPDSFQPFEGTGHHVA